MESKKIGTQRQSGQQEGIATNAQRQAVKVKEGKKLSIYRSRRSYERGILSRDWVEMGWWGGSTQIHLGWMQKVESRVCHWTGRKLTNRLLLQPARGILEAAIMVAYLPTGVPDNHSARMNLGMCLLISSHITIRGV